MKYVTPKYEVAVVETEDVLTASSGQAIFQLNNRKAVQSKIYMAFFLLKNDG